jgi:hypothetical protein
VTTVDADIDALRELHAALVRFRYSQRDVLDRAGLAIDTALAALSMQTAETDVELEGIRRWEQRVEEESSAYHGGASRFRDLLEIDLPRTEDHLLTLIASLEACRTDPI